MAWTRIARRSGVSLALALLLAVLPAVDADAAGAFWDDNGNTHERAIEGLAAADVTRSCDPTRSRYCPDLGVERGQMAAFLSRALGLPQASRDHFVDDDHSIFEGDINRIAEAGITNGCNPPDHDEFCPDAVVTRGQMAAFLDRAYEPPATDDDFFTDDDGSMFEAAINRIAAAGITKGCNPPDNDHYCPTEDVRRDQMASFLARADDRVRSLDPYRLHERTITYEVRALNANSDQDLVPLLSRRAKEALYAHRSWNIQHRLLLEEVADGGAFTIYLTDEEDVDAQAPGCSRAYSCTVGNEIHINEQNFVSRPAPWAGETQPAYQRYVVMHEVGHYLDFDDTADSDDPSHYNDEVYCYDRDGDGDREAPVMKQQSIDTGGCTTNGQPLAFERDCVEEAWLADTTDQGDGDGDIDDQCPHQPTER